MSGSKEVVCAIILRGDRVLATRRKNEGSRPGKWEFPGGKVQENETHGEAIIREIREELNIIVTPVKKFPFVEHEYRDVKIRLIPVFCNWVEGNIRLIVHERYDWITVNQFNYYDWSEADRSLFLLIKDLIENSDGIAV